MVKHVLYHEPTWAVAKIQYCSKCDEPVYMYMYAQK